jgi:predicted AlkP superfamily phosphohydrolase/phosphomutase
MLIQKKVIVLGLDGATFKLIGPWIEKGLLPNFKRVIEQGVSGQLRTCLPPTTAVAWPSFFTGTNPGKHSSFGFTRVTSDYKYKICSGNRVKAKPIWNILADSGLKSALINLPMTYPPQPINGEVITGLVTPSELSSYTFPKSLKGRLKEIVGTDYVIHPLPYRSNNEDAFLLSLNQTMQMRFDLINHYLQQNYDLIIGIVGGTDKLSHAMLKYVDSNNPLFNESESKKWSGKIIDYYKKIDSNLGQLMSRLGREYNLLIMSDHGSDSFKISFNVNQWLIDKGFLVLKSKKKKKLFFLKGEFANSFASFLERNGLLWFKRLAKKFLPWRVIFHSGADKIVLGDIDWTETKAFASPEGWGIFINSKDKYMGGVVSAEEIQPLKNRIISELRSLKDPNEKELNGLIYDANDIYSGAYAKNAPDVLFFFQNVSIHSVRHKLWKSIDSEEVSGGHDMNGIFFAYGVDVKQDYIINDANIIDVAPTILKIMDIDIPSEIDGQVLKQIFKEQK